MIGRLIERRVADLLAQINAGQVRSWRDAMALHPNVGWGSLRPALKLLRDRGQIKTDAEYNHIRPAQGGDA